jgi:hypothetical protein
MACSTTGNLWVSDNGGEQWQIINAHLPLIYAVWSYEVFATWLIDRKAVPMY